MVVGTWTWRQLWTASLLSSTSSGQRQLCFVFTRSRNSIQTREKLHI